MKINGIQNVQEIVKGIKNLDQKGVVHCTGYLGDHWVQSEWREKYKDKINYNNKWQQW